MLETDNVLNVFVATFGNIFLQETSLKTGLILSPKQNVLNFNTYDRKSQ